MASKKASAASPVSAAQRLGERRRRQRPGGDDDVVPLGRRLENFLAADVDERLAFERRGDGGGKAVTIDRECAARRQLVGVGGVQHQRAEPAHLGVEKADGAAVRIVGAERVRADELGEVAPFCARQSSAPGASRAAPPARRGARSARRPRNPQGRRRSREWVVSYASRSQNRSRTGGEQSAPEFCDSRTI